MGERKFPPWKPQDWVLTSSVMDDPGTLNPTDVMERLLSPPYPTNPPKETVDQLKANLAHEIETVKLEKRNVRASLRNELEAKKKRARKDLAKTLKASRARLKELKLELARVGAELERARSHVMWLQGKVASLASVDRPPAPPPCVSASVDGKGLPAETGIYFVWREGVVVYVGQSVDISRRARIANHHAIRQGDELSWLPFPKAQLTASEHWYIAVLSPDRNRG